MDSDIDLSQVVKIVNSTPPVGSTGERDGSGKLIVEPFKCTFDGLFGGDQYGVKPIKEYPGVTVNYPASYQQ